MYIFFYILSFLGVIAVLVSENRNPVKSVAWIAVLILAPVVGVIFYIFFGQDYTKQRLISKQQLRRIIKTGETEAVVQPEALDESYQLLATMLAKHPLAKLYGGNEIEVYTSGKEKMKALFEAIESARHHIHVQYYIFLDDEIGRCLQQLLIRKVRSGVEVRVLVDSLGRWGVKDAFFQEMMDAGVLFQEFIKIRLSFLTNKVNYRNHRKVVVVDGCIGFVGGMNIADRYVKGNHLGLWRDTHVRIKGEAVYALQSSFFVDWYYTQKQLPELNHYFPPIESAGHIPVQIVTDGPFGSFTPIQQGFIKLLLSARKYVYLQTPYFLPTEPLLMAMKTAAMSGVDVRLMIPMKSDTKIAHWATCSYVKRLLQVGIKVYLYDGGFLHSKTVVADDYAVSIGSANLDFRSFEHNFEILMLAYNEQFAVHMRKQFLNDQRTSLRVTRSYWEKRKPFDKVASTISRVFSPLL